MTIRLSLDCPHCKGTVVFDVDARVVGLEGPHGDLRTVVVAKPAPAKLPKTTCACGHGREWHSGDQHDGPCTYAPGRCDCAFYHARKNLKAYAKETERTPVPAGPKSLDGPQKSVLSAIAQVPGWVSREELTVMTGYARSTRNRVLQELVRSGRVEVRDDGSAFASASGRSEVAGVAALPSGAALLSWWLESKLNGPQSTVLAAIARGVRLTRDEVGEITGYARSTRNRLLQELQRRHLVLDVGGKLAAHPLLFDKPKVSEALKTFQEAYEKVGSP